MSYRINLGNHAVSGKKISVPFDDLKRHFHVLGRTGKGKTKALEILAHEIILSGCGIVLLDGKGDLYDSILSFCVEEHLAKRVAIIDPTDTLWACGLNYLELLGNTDAETLAEMVMEGLKKSFEEEGEFKPLQEEWTPASLLPLIKAKMTLIELEDFVSMTRPELRRAILKTLNDEGKRLLHKWEELKAYGDREAAIRTAVVRTRGAILHNSPMAEAIFGQIKTTINWRKVLDEGGIVLIRVHRHPKISKRLRILIGTTVIHQLIETAFSRPKDERPDAWLMADEFQQFCCADFVEGLAQLRSFKLWLILANQELKQLETVPGLKEAVLAECTGKLYFSLSHIDANETVHEIFQGDIHGNDIKHQTFQTKTRAIETERTIESDTESRGHGNSNSETSSVSENPLGLAQSEGTSQGASDGKSSVHAHGETVVPFYEYEEFLEESSRQYYSIEEKTEKLKEWLMLQEPRKAQLKLGDHKAVPIITRFIKDPVALEEEREEFIDTVMPQCAIPFDEAKKAIEKRAQLYIEAFKEAEELKMNNEKEKENTPRDSKNEESTRAKQKKKKSRWETPSS